MGGGRKKCSDNEKGSKVTPLEPIRKEGKKRKREEATISFKAPLSTPDDVGILCSAHRDGSNLRVSRRTATHNVSYKVDTSDRAATPDSHRAPDHSPNQHRNLEMKKRKQDGSKEESVRAHVRVQGVGLCFPDTQGAPPSPCTLVFGHNEPQRPPVNYNSWPADRIRKLRQVPENEWFPLTRDPHVHDLRFWTVTQENFYHSLRSSALHVHRVLQWDELKTASEGRDIKSHFSHIDGLDKLVSMCGMKWNDDIIYVFFASLWIAPNRSYIRFMYGDQPRHLTKQELADALGIRILGPSIHSLAYPAYPEHPADSCRQKLKATKPADQKVRILFEGSVPDGFTRKTYGLTHEALVTLKATRISVLPRFGYRDGFTPLMQWVLYHLMSHQPFDFIDLMISEMEDAIYDKTKRRLPYGPYILRAFDWLGWVPFGFYAELGDVSLYRVPKPGDKRLGTRTSAGNNEIQTGDGVVDQNKENDSSTSTQPLPQPAHETTQLPEHSLMLEVLGGFQQNLTLVQKALAILANDSRIAASDSHIAASDVRRVDSDLRIVVSDVQMICEHLGISGRSRLP